MLLSVLSTNMSALDVRVGKGDFKSTQGVDDLYNISVSVDIDVLSLNEQHYSINDSNLYLFGNLDLYSSKQVDTYTNIVDTIMNTSTPTLPGGSPITLPGTTPNEALSNFVPVPSSYEVRGVDLDIGVGYDVLKEEKGYLGLGVMTGISTPFMEMENYVEAMNFYTESLQETDTEMTTYKLGLSLQGGYDFTDYLGLYVTGIYAYQIGEIENSIVSSSMDAKGSYKSFDIGLIFHPATLSQQYKESLWSAFYLNIGHAYKKWEVEEVKATIAGVDTPDVISYFDIGLESSYTYFGVGYSF